MTKKLFLAFAFLTIASGSVMAQKKGSDSTSDEGDDLMSILDSEQPAAPRRSYVTATFKSTRVINGHSIENVARGVLDFRISHRFGPVNQGLKDFFGLDGATTRLGFDYGVTDWLMVGIGRSTFQKEVDGLIKVRLLRQREGGRMPVSVSYLGNAGIQTADVAVPAGKDYYFSNRVANANQLIIARKFSSGFSLQLMSTHVHYNLVPLAADPNEVLAMGVAGRIKLSHRISFTGEYYYTLPEYKLSGSRNALSLGFDIETGGHVFQLMFTNARGMSERTFVGQTTDDWGAGDIHFGFNISRVFTIVKPKGMAGMRNKIY